MQRLLLGLGGLLVALAIVLTLLKPSHGHPPPPTGPVATGCDLGAGPCRVELGGGRALTLTASPRPLQLLEPLSLEASITGGEARAVRVTLSSLSMDMGVTRLALEPDGPGRFTGHGQLPVCTSDVMRWAAELSLELDGAPVTRLFTFETRRAITPADAGVAAGAAEYLDGPVVDFTLTSATGPVRLSAFRGKVVLLYFGYTFCPDVCPTSLAATARVLRELPEAQLARVQPVFVSVDPERDSPAHLAEYARFFHPSILGLTGSPAEVAAAAKPFGVVYAKQAVPGAAGYVVDHSALTYLVAPDGHLAARLPHAARAPVVLEALGRFLPTR